MSDNHGNTIAAWTAVAVALAGFVVAGIALMAGSWPMFWVGVALVPLALIVLGILTKMGYGSSRHST
jgi:ABC-type multidrug transport system fused ATPase/permease subunit